MRTVDIYSAYCAEVCNRKKKKHFNKSFVVIAGILLASILVISIESSNGNSMETSTFAAPSPSPHQETKLTVPNHDGWLPPSKVRELEGTYE